MLENPETAFGAGRRTWTEFAILGGCLGLAHGTAESAFQAIWDVPLTAIDIAFTLSLCGLIGLMVGIAIRSVCSIITWLSRLGGWQHTPTGRRRAFWLGAVPLHAAVAGWMLSERTTGANFAVLLTLTGVAAILLAILGYARAASPGRLLVTAIGLTWFNISITFLPAVEPDLPGSAAYWIAMAVLFLPPLACMILPAIIRPPSKTGTDRHRPAVIGLLGFVAIGTIVSTFVMPLGLDWHIRSELNRITPERDDTPNILLIVLDTVRADHLDAFGYSRSTMPELAKFSRESCQVSRTILATAPSTLPTHASMFTGQYSHVHGAHQPFLVHEGPRPEYGYPLREDLPTLAEHLSGLGFQTAGIVGNYGVLGGYGLNRGFDYYDVAPGASYRGRQISWLHSSPITSGPVNTLINVSLPEDIGRSTELYDSRNPPYRRAKEITDRTIEWLAHRDKRPFFLFANFFDAHDPYLPVHESKDRFMPEGKHVDRAGFIPHHMFLRIMRGEGSIPDAWRTALIAQYDAELFYLDGQLHRLLDEFRKMPCFDDTLIIITSDHGEGFLEHGLLRHGTSTDETQVRVPLFVKFPKVMADSAPTIPAWFQFVDLYPSIMQVLNEAPPQNLAGSPWASGRKHALSEVFVHEPEIEWLRRELCTVQIGQHKYTRSTTGAIELYDIANDLGETRNLAGTLHAIEAQAEEIISKRNASLVRELTSSGEDTAMQQKLRSLGYLK